MLLRSFFTSLTLLLLAGFGTSAISEPDKFVITGRVVGHDLKPVVKAYVVVHPPGPTGDLITFSKTDSEGRFRYEE
jgi:hypothetical protein